MWILLELQILRMQIYNTKLNYHKRKLLKEYAIKIHSMGQLGLALGVHILVESPLSVRSCAHRAKSCEFRCEDTVLSQIQISKEDMQMPSKYIKKLPSITSHCGNVNQSHHEMSLHYSSQCCLSQRWRRRNAGEHVNKGDFLSLFIFVEM